jgi:EcsC protein family
MSVTGKAAGMASKQLAPRIGELAPGLTTTFVREALHRAIVGVGPLPPASKAAEAQLREQKGNVDKAVHEVIENHVRYAAAQGFVTNVGGLVTIAITIPTNITGLALIQCRMIAGIAHLRGYDLDDPRVRNAILCCMIGEDAVNSMVKKRLLPAPPMALATAPLHDADLDKVISSQVAAEMVSKVAGKQLVTTIGRRIPIAGGFFGMGADAYVTWKVGRYADRELLPRARL